MYAAHFYGALLIYKAVGRLDFEYVSVEIGITYQRESGNGGTFIAHMDRNVFQLVNLEIECFMQRQLVYGFVMSPAVVPKLVKA